jgi:hypothetical protein
MVAESDVERVEFSSEGGAPVLEPKRPEKPTRVAWTKPGRVVEGVYLERREEDRGSYKQRVHLLRDAKRDYELPGAARLDALLAKVPFGTLTRVTFTGWSQTDRSTRRAFTVEADDGQPEGVA